MNKMKFVIFVLVLSVFTGCSFKGPSLELGIPALKVKGNNGKHLGHKKHKWK